MNSKELKELIGILKKSETDFLFDEVSGLRLFNAIKNTDQLPRKSLLSLLFHSPLFKYSSAVAVAVLLIASTFTAAADSHPGDKLFAVNKFREKAVLSLPLSAQKKAEFQASFVAKRLEALDQIQGSKNLEAKKLETVKESDETFNLAIEAISENKLRLESLGQTKAAADLEGILEKLETMAGQREHAIKQMEDHILDEKIKSEMENHLQQIRKGREKARLRIKSGTFQDLQKNHDGW